MLENFLPKVARHRLRELLFVFACSLIRRHRRNSSVYPLIDLVETFTFKFLGASEFKLV